MNDVRVTFLVSKKLLERIDQTSERWGFMTRAEFFRFCAVDFLKNEDGALPSDDALREYSLSIKSIKAAKRLHKQRWGSF